MFALRTSSRAHLVPTDGPEWTQVEAPPSEGPCVTIRPLSSSEFFEVSAIARLKARKALESAGLDPDDRDASSKLEAAYVGPLAAAHGLVEVSGVPGVDRSNVMERLTPARAAALGMAVFELSMATADPFEPGGSVR